MQHGSPQQFAVTAGKDWHPFIPKFVSAMREGYSAHDFRADVFAGITVAVVALPLSMALAIASGVTPERGLFTAVVAGFIIAALGGSRHQIGGPTGTAILRKFLESTRGRGIRMILAGTREGPAAVLDAMDIKAERAASFAEAVAMTL